MLNHPVYTLRISNCKMLYLLVVLDIRICVRSRNILPIDIESLLSASHLPHQYMKQPCWHYYDLAVRCWPSQEVHVRSESCRKVLPHPNTTYCIPVPDGQPKPVNWLPLKIKRAHPRFLWVFSITILQLLFRKYSQSQQFWFNPTSSDGIVLSRYLNFTLKKRLKYCLGGG